MIIIKILESLLEIIYPNICGICEKINKNSLCEECKESIKSITIAKIDNYKNDSSKCFDKHGYIFKYSGKIRKTILDFKFNEKAYLYKTFAKIIMNNKNISEFINQYEIIIPVPIHLKRYYIRGYNQSELLAKEIVRNYQNLDFDGKILIKIKNNTAQSNLNKKEREKNVKGVYQVKNNLKVKDRKILLIDDVYTTGNTANECAKMLKRAGAKEVGIITIAKD